MPNASGRARALALKIELQHKAMRRAEETLEGVGLNVRLKAIWPTELEQADKWMSAPNRRVIWDWNRVSASYGGDPDRFGFSIWSGNQLCGLAVGRVRASYVSLDFLEGAPDSRHPFKGEIVNIALTVLRALALAHGRPYMRLNEPLADLIDIYRGFGFDYHQPKGEPSYCEMKL